MRSPKNHRLSQAYKDLKFRLMLRFYIMIRRGKIDIKWLEKYLEY